MALEAGSDLIAEDGFDLACAPERVDPGDSVSTLRNLAKIVSGLNERALSRVAGLYNAVVGTVVQSLQIPTAEAARLIENSQRDL